MISRPVFHTDPWFYIAALAGPAIWLLFDLLSLAGTSTATFEQGVSVILFKLIIYPVLEEIVFRGLIQGWISARVSHSSHGVSLSNVITSIIFTAVHFFNNPSLLTLLIFFPSIIFGCAKERYNKLTPPIILHSLYNIGL